MWEVQEHRDLIRRLPRLPRDIRKRYELWKAIVRLSGPIGLKQLRGLRDEALRGEWRGCRASSLNQKYRVIYCIEGDECFVLVLDVNAHDYRRK